MKLEDLYKIRLELSGVKINKPEEKKFIEPNPCWEGYEAIGLKPDGSPNCVPIKEEQSKVVKEGFPIPSPESGEDENTFISRCMKEIGGEYDQDQALGICYSKLRGK
jgi:hypothetical protein